jgi:hypothetical protein
MRKNLNNLEEKEILLLQREEMQLKDLFSTLPQSNAMAHVVTMLNSINDSQKLIVASIPKMIDTIISPSEFAKPLHNNVFREVLSLCGFGSESLSKRIQDSHSLLPSDTQRTLELDFIWSWDEEYKEYSFESLNKFFSSRNIHMVNVSKGENLIDGVLFHEELWTMKRNTRDSSDELRMFIQIHHSRNN